jgi:5-methylcytosine-specific restriction enzyme subunit McrC
MDTKWKLVTASANSSNEKYGLSQGDFYQLFAYGEKYLGGEGDMFLIYPLHSGFKKPLPFFDFKPGLRLWVLPFDLFSECLITPRESVLDLSLIGSGAAL